MSVELWDRNKNLIVLYPSYQGSIYTKDEVRKLANHLLQLAGEEDEIIKPIKVKKRGKKNRQKRNVHGDS